MMFRDEVGGGVEVTVEERPSDGGSGPFLVCRLCRHRIVREDARIVVGGTHGHVFCNPHGIVFELGCFANAPGCAHQGPRVAEFSWFAGYTWQVALCGGCGELMGWRFGGAGGDAFHGLILPHLEPEADGDDG